MSYSKNHILCMKKIYTDNELVSHYLTTRQPDYFNQLYERYCHKVHRKCFLFTNDKMQADDLTQDIFMRLLGKLDSYKQQAKFSTWLYSITSNYCTDQVRSARSRYQPVLLENWGSLTLISDELDIEQVELTKKQIQQVLLQLPQLEQQLLQKKYQEDLSIRELALHYSLTESAIKMRLKRSRDRFRYYYQQAIR